MFLVVSYDITDDRRRNRIHRALKGFGEGVQYSVFECIMGESEVTRMKTIVERLVKKGRDHVRYYRLCENCVSRIETLGGMVSEVQRTYVV